MVVGGESIFYFQVGAWFILIGGRWWGLYFWLVVDGVRFILGGAEWWWVVVGLLCYCCVVDRFFWAVVGDGVYFLGGGG